MTEQYPYRATIQLVPDGTPRPFWSVMIPTYNCAQYLRETLTSVLAQDAGPDVMQIEVVDDHSTKDDPEAVVRELAGERVSFYRQPKNVGYIKNFNTCLPRSRGKLIHLLHGDDCIGEGFYSKMQHLFEKHPEIGTAFYRHIYMDNLGPRQSISPLEQPDSGVLSNWLEQIAAGQRVTTASIVVRRDVYEKLGGYDSRFTYTGEDWEMYVRIAIEYPVAYEVEPLALYRTSLGSLSQNSIRSGRYFHDLRLANSIIQSYLPNYLPKNIAGQLSKQAKETYAIWAVSNANQIFWKTGDIKTSIVQIKEALKSSYSLRVNIKLIFSILKMGLYQFKHIIQIAK